MRVLVTGSKGFVAGHLQPRLRAEGWEVVGRDLEVDVSDPRAVEALFDEVEPDAVAHLAAMSSVAQSRGAPALTHRVNYHGSLSILQAAFHRRKRPRVLLVGSSEQYGMLAPGSAPFDESSPFRPRSAYARSKAEADQLGAAFARSGLDVVRVRAFNHSGPGQSDVFVLSSFARQVAEIEAGLREPALRVGNLDSVRDFLDVSDVIDAYVRLLDPAVPADAYNVASGVGRRIGDLLDALLAHATVKPSVTTDPERFRAADFAVGDATRLREATGWQPRTPFETTIANLLGYWRERLNAP